tara:strand:- start:656 stop:1015 length:360 start_codon:yes stop_codon:yes gene_type:complete
MKTKEELEQAIIMLEERVVSNTSEMISVQADLKDAQKQLKDVNKPELTPLQFDNVYEAIEKGIGNFDFDDEGNYDKEFEIDYDNRIQLSNFDFINSQDLLEMIVEEVNKLFVETKDTDE